MQKENLKSRNAPESGPVSVHYVDGNRLGISERPLREAIGLIWSESKTPFTSVPLKIFFSNKLLYADKNLFLAYQKEELDYDQLILSVECDKLFRNKHQVSGDGISIEIGSLWKLKGKVLYLVDDDQDVVSELDEAVFELI